MKWLAHIEIPFYLEEFHSEELPAPTDYNLKLIKDGKVPDPMLEAGDTN